ncbi:MAG: aspartate aminotransferase family protein [Candidatus Faecivivens sp.]|nr:aspartate aminotransferase family protein [Oscillospiraceae bacterium]MDY2711847.1 aspartate aminotransferase family protein [Candidatus Faecivivens sp.]
MTFQEIKAHDQAHIMNTYGRSDACIVTGKGALCKDTEGKEYIDFTSGIGVNSLGFCDEDWVKAVSAQASTLQHISNLYYTLPDVELADTLCARTGYAKVFFGNSGAEANEGAIKVARKYSFDTYGAGRDKIVTLVNSFHGRTVTTLAATGQDVFHTFFFPFTEGFVYAKAGSMEDLKAACDGSVCALMLEFIQGEGGVVPLDPEYVKEAAAFCKENDILLIADEVQTGIGRTGTLLASEQFGVFPDITTLAKGLGGGLPIGAVMVSEKLSNVMGASSHGSTFGGNPVVCAGANTVLKKLDDTMLKSVLEKGETIRAALSGCKNVASITGLGMMIGIELKEGTSAEVRAACMEKGLLVLTAKAKVRLLPPLTISDEELEKGLEILKIVLDA